MERTQLEEIYWAYIEKVISDNKPNLIRYWGTRMSAYSENFRGTNGHSPCPLCLGHIDSQAASFLYPEIVKNVQIKGNYKDIFSDIVDSELANTLVEIDKVRHENQNNRNIEM